MKVEHLDRTCRLIKEAYEAAKDDRDSEIPNREDIGASGPNQAPQNQNKGYYTEPPGVFYLINHKAWTPVNRIKQKNARAIEPLNLCTRIKGNYPITKIGGAQIKLSTDRRFENNALQRIGVWDQEMVPGVTHGAAYSIIQATTAEEVLKDTTISKSGKIHLLAMKAHSGQGATAGLTKHVVGTKAYNDYFEGGDEPLARDHMPPLLQGNRRKFRPDTPFDSDPLDEDWDPEFDYHPRLDDDQGEEDEDEEVDEDHQALSQHLMASSLTETPKEQQLYSKPLPGNRAPYPISKGAPRQPTEEAHFGRLYLGSYPFNHDPELLTIVSHDSSSLLSEEQLQCSICLDVFTDPVTTPCGHNFCKSCITQCWEKSQHCHCPLCNEKFTKRPEMKINTTLREVADHFKKKSGSDKPEVFCDACTGKKLKALKSCLNCCASLCETHLEFHNNMPKHKKHKLIKPVENLEDYICQKHERALELFCRDDQMCVCQFCTETNHKNHNTVPIEEESRERKTQLQKTQTDVQQMIQDRLKKIKEMKHSVEFSKRSTEKEKADSVEVFTALIRSIERSQAELLEVMEEKQKAAERQAEGLIKELEQEITVLKRRDTELEQISHTEEHLHLLQIYSSMCSPPHTKNWTEISINTGLSGDTVRTTLSQLQQTLNEKLTTTLDDKLKETVDVTLDPDTAHPKLILSADGKQVTHGDTRQNLPDTPQRFDKCPCVLGKQSFSSGRFYYEVQVRGKTAWDVGVVTESINRKGKIKLNPKKWILDCLAEE
ncbi:hypothetical protein QTP70_004072 [Hemibagrus guttatus]|uniref:Uncharacterized protein n=1 Tax=Hemibagrus guttatus TaxID=175788 RepID=A0AAE0R6Z9_9TELE|nr:hypothetical protein QTP70_004072 [Hemibagrus guttatus]